MTVAAAVAARAVAGDFTPRVGLILGSGLGDVAKAIAETKTVSYRDLPGFPESTVEGHAGRLVLGNLSGVPVACLQGRAHLYEGHAPAELAIPIRTLKELGCDTLVLTNAAGSLDPAIPVGGLMLLSDHINFTGRNPLTGPNDDAFGPRFFDMTDAYDPDLRRRFLAAAAEEAIALTEGVYLCYPGPNFETPAEIRAFRVLGADAVGMSTVPECLVARHCGLRVAAISTITNMAAGLGGAPLSHAQTLMGTGQAAHDVGRLLARFLRNLDAAAEG